MFGSGATRFAVKYASADRWEHSSVSTRWQLPDGSADPAVQPKMCAQVFSSDDMTEDCLSMTLFVPPGANPTKKLPIMMWIHGGSLIVGSSSATGLTSPNLAYRNQLYCCGNSIPSMLSNSFQTIAPSFGGDKSKVTIAGQSSGASLVRALLATPSASFSFHDATQDQFFASASVAPQAGSFVPIRMVNDGKLINTPLDSTAKFPKVSKPVLITTVNHEAGNAIYGGNTDPVTVSDYIGDNTDTFGPARANTILSSDHYNLPSFSDGEEDTRPQLEAIGTDYIWRCASWTFARNWVRQWWYPSNAGVPFCQENGVICHEDDIQVVFGTIPNPDSTQSTLMTQMQQRYKAFLASGNPNANGLSSWAATSGSSVNILNIGGTAAIPVGACDPSFWGSAVQYDYQVYNI
ncbi:alpha/beta-hydrolase [Flagelloscypha sp. PMI_526]|nr:alpha/beta-hydrolase [Flagelloscypha sp. PMI_526]